MNKENRMSRVALPEYQGGTLEEYMEVLYAHQKTCEKGGKYMEAETAKRHLVKVKAELERQRKEELFQRFEGEKQQVEMAHVQEITSFNKYWDEKMDDYSSEANRMEQETIERHQQEEAEFEEGVVRSLAQTNRDTSEVINLRKIEENLAKQENYLEAHKVQRQIQALEKSDYERWQRSKENKVKNLMEQLRAKQKTELNALVQKIDSGYEEQQKIRKNEYEKLIQKYNNFMKELENQQHQEVIKFEKSTKMQSTINFSRASTSRAMQHSRASNY